MENIGRRMIERGGVARAIGAAIGQPRVTSKPRQTAVRVLTTDEGHVTTSSHTRLSYLEDPCYNVTRTRNATDLVGRFAGKSFYAMVDSMPMFEPQLCYQQHPPILTELTHRGRHI